VKDMEKALRSIVSLWPDPGMCAELVPEWVGPNDGRMRADMLWTALNTAREALGLPTYPEPEHWKKPRRSRHEAASAAEDRTRAGNHYNTDEDEEDE